MKKCNRCGTIVTDNIPFCPICYKESTGNDLVLSNDVCDYFNQKQRNIGMGFEGYNNRGKKKSSILPIVITLIILAFSLVIIFMVLLSDSACIKRSVKRYYKRERNTTDVEIVNKLNVTKSITKSIDNYSSDWGLSGDYVYSEIKSLISSYGVDVSDIEEIYYVTVNVDGSQEHVICYKDSSGWHVEPFW